MKRLIPFLLFLGSLCYSQAVRVDQPLLTSGPQVPVPGGALAQTLWYSNANVYICASPSASLAACQASLITTYTDATLSTPCTNGQLVQLPGNTCTLSSGATANVGFWYNGSVASTLDYWITSSYGNAGPFTITPGGGNANVSNQANGVIPLATAPNTIGAQSPLSVNGGIINSATGYTPFATARPFYTMAFGASDFASSSPAVTLGIDSTTNFAQGITSTIRQLFPTHGGLYTTQQSNQYSNYYGFLFNRSQGTNQLFGYGQYNLGRGDNVIQSGDQQCFGGGGRQVGGIGTPACQFAQSVQYTGLNTFTATVNGSGTTGQVTYNYTPTSNEVPSAGARTILNLDRVVNTGTATAVGTTVTFSGAPNMTTLNPSPIGQMLVLGSTSDGYAPNMTGTAGGATGTFQGFSNPGQVYSVTVGNNAGTGYVQGEQVSISGCGSGDAKLNLNVTGGSVTRPDLFTTPTGSSGYSVASNCTTTSLTGSGTGLTVNIVQVTGVVGSAGQLCNVNNFSGGTGAQSTTGWSTGQLEFALTGTNTIANGTPFNGGGFKQPYNNVVNATAAQMVLATPSNAISAVCAGNINLSATTFPCQGDDVLLSGVCTGHASRISAVNSSTSVTIENAVDSRLTSALAANTPYSMYQSFDLTDIDTINHTFTAYGQMQTAVALTAGSSITPGVYLLNGTGGLAGGKTCATPPTAPTSGNLQCPQIEVIVNSLGQVSSVIPIVAGPTSYTSPPTFTMTGANVNTGGGTANCASTCPTFQAYLDNNVNQYAWQNGDHLFQPADSRTQMQQEQAIQNIYYLNQLGTTYQSESLGPGRAFAAFSTLGNSGTGTGGYQYSFYLGNTANNDYTFFMPGGTNPITNKPFKIQHSFINFSGGFTSGDSFLDFSQLSAPSALNLVGGKWTSIATGASQPNATPAMFVGYKDKICLSFATGQCFGGISGSGDLNTTFGLTLNPGTPMLSSAPNYLSAVFTDNVNGGMFFESLNTGANILGGWFGNSGLKTLHSYSLSGPTLLDASQAQTTFPAIRITPSGQFVSSTDNNVAHTQMVTTAPGGPATLPAIISGGTKFTTSGCAVSSTTGGASAGIFTLGANTCSVVITMNGATGLTAPTGWSCQAHDRTAPTVLIGGESSSTTTTATITIPAGAGATDVISFSCTAF